MGRKASKKPAGKVRIPGSAIPGVLLVFVAFSLYIGMVVEPPLIYYVQQPFFQLDKSFLLSHLKYVGGPIEYVASFLGLFLRNAGSGATILTGLAAIICLLWRDYLVRLGMPRNGLRYLLGAFCLAWMHTNYYSPLAPTLDTAVALLFVFVLVRVGGGLWIRNGVFAALAGVLYYAGGGVVVFFGVLYLLHSLACRGKSEAPQENIPLRPLQRGNRKGRFLAFFGFLEKSGDSQRFGDAKSGDSHYFCEPKKVATSAADAKTLGWEKRGQTTFFEYKKRSQSPFFPFFAAAFAVAVVGLLPLVLNSVFFKELPVYAYGHLVPRVLEWTLPRGIASLYASLGFHGRGVPIETAVFQAALVAVSLYTVLVQRLRGRVEGFSFVKQLNVLRERRYAGWIVSPWVGFLCVGGLVSLDLNTGEKQLITLRQFADSGQWKEYCDYANAKMASHPVFDRTAERSLSDLVTVLVNDNRMLYHVNLLPYQMFSFPQSLGGSSLLLTDRTFYLNNNELFLPMGDLLFELGRVNEAERAFFESWAFYGERASILWRMARLNVVKGRYEAARVFLNILKEVPFEREAAVQMEANMDQDPELGWDKELKRIRSCNFKVDIPETIHDLQDQIMAALLKSNPNNRMAYEYLMSYFLLNGQKENVVNYLRLLKQFRYQEIPRHYEEALVAYMAEKGLQTVDTGGYRINPDTVRKYGEFRRLAVPCNGDPGKLWDALAPGFGNTYWLYEAMGGARVGIKNGEYAGE